MVISEFRGHSWIKITMKQVRDVPLGLIISCRNLSIFFLIINSLWFCIFWSFLFEECSVISSVSIFSSFQVKRRVVRKMWKEFNEDGDAEDGWPGCKLQISGIGSDRSSNSTTTSSQVSTYTFSAQSFTFTFTDVANCHFLSRTFFNCY